MRIGSHLGDVTAPTVGAPGLPIGYDPTTGTISGNSTGTTSIPGYTDPSILDTTQSLNAAAQAQCQGSGGTYDPNTGLCSTNWTPYFVLGGAVLLILIIAISGRR